MIDTIYTGLSFLKKGVFFERQQDRPLASWPSVLFYCGLILMNHTDSTHSHLFYYLQYSEESASEPCIL
jgi:hypothetical protein